MNKPLLLANHHQLWFLPLGGTGEIGMNMNLYGHDGQWLMVDCGVSFDEPLEPDYNTRPSKKNSTDEKLVSKRFDRVCADPNFITQQRQHLAGIIITHAHEDHVGAVADLWPQLQCPIYTTKFTAICLRKKLAEKRLSQDVTIIEVETGSTVAIGSFDVKWLSLTHSLPDPHALLINTSVGSVFHTADWKIDPNPVLGKPFDPNPYKHLGTLGIDAMVCDSTNATRAGKTPSEGDCYQGLKEHTEQANGRVIATCFGSNVARLVTLCKIAKETNRYVGLLGRSLHNMVRCARQAGIWPDDYSISDARHLAYLPKEEVLLIATGSQGEPRAALNRLAQDNHPDIELEAGDTVIFSSIVIPGNEKPIEALQSMLTAKKITVITSENSTLPIHASGHPSQHDLTILYQWVKPKLAIPTHGEPQHLKANAQIAKAAGVPRQLTGLNGDLFEISSQPHVRTRVAKVGRIALND